MQELHPGEIISVASLRHFFLSHLLWAAYCSIREKYWLSQTPSPSLLCPPPSCHMQPTGRAQSLSDPNPADPRAVFKEQCWALGSHTAVANLATGVGSNVVVTGAVPALSRAPTLTHCITSSIKILSYSQVCNVSCPKSPAQQIRLSVEFLLSGLQQQRASPANKKCLYNCASPHFRASSICNHLPFLCFLSTPS